MINMQQAPLLLVFCLSLTVPANAQPPSLDTQLAACASEANDVARLTCYDALSGRVAAASSAAPPVSTPPPSVPVLVEQTPEQKFGESGVRANKTTEVPKEAVPELKSLDAVVVSLARGSRGQLVMTLDNDQVWQEKDSSTYFPVKAGDTVTIRSRLLGAFSMKGPGGRSTQVTRVR